MKFLDLIKKSILDLRGYFSVLLVASIPLSLLPIAIHQNKTLGIFLVLVLSGPLRFSLSKMSLALVRKESIKVTQLFEGFHYFKNSLGVFLLSIVFVLLGLVAFIIPGIIIFIALSQSYFILADDPDLEPMDVFKKSRSIMKGLEVKFFLIIIIFTCASLLLVLTKLTLVSLLLVPIQYVTLANFYENIKK